jgi:hypothetical protein
MILRTYSMEQTAIYCPDGLVSLVAVVGATPRLMAVPDAWNAEDYGRIQGWQAS